MELTMVCPPLHEILSSRLTARHMQVYVRLDEEKEMTKEEKGDNRLYDCLPVPSPTRLRPRA